MFKKKEKMQPKEVKQASEAKPDMIHILKLLSEFKITVLYCVILCSLMEKKIDNLQDPMGNVSREIETLQKNQRKY